MSDLLAARSQMAISLGFHILFAVAGIAMPLLMVIAEWLWLTRGHKPCLQLAKRWAKGTAVLFAIGAISGTVLSFELGLLWPRFMGYAGAIIGMPFSLEGFAFFLEAIFIGIYFYGWEKVSPMAHWISGLMVLASGTLSGIFVVTANAWMNTPAGFDLVGSTPVNIRPFAAMMNPAALSEVVHMTLASFLSVGFTVAAIHAYRLLKNPENPFDRWAYSIALCVGAVAALLQPLSGDFSARHVARQQKIKLAAMEGQWDTERGAPLRIGGWVDESSERTRFAIEIPGALSLLAYGDPEAVVLGLKEVPKDDRPPTAVVHAAFQIMVAAGFSLLAVALLGGALVWRRRGIPFDRWYLKLVALCGPLGFCALEAGWTVTEVGRQPWIIHGLLRVRDAVTHQPSLGWPLAATVLIYLLLAFTVLSILRRQFDEATDGA